MYVGFFICLFVCLFFRFFYLIDKLAQFTKEDARRRWKNIRRASAFVFAPTATRQTMSNTVIVC